MIYDQLIIGSGPSCYGYLLGTNRHEQRICIVSSEALPVGEGVGLHPKLSRENYKFVRNEAGYSFGETSCLGGLSNAWGGLLSPFQLDEADLDVVSEIFADLITVFDLYSFSDKIPNKIDISNICEEIKKDPNGIFVLVGRDRYSWERSGISLWPRVNELALSNKVDIFKNRVNFLTYEQSEKCWVLSLDNGDTKRASKVIFAAGALGNLALLEVNLNSTQSLWDHTPLQFLCLDLALSKRSPGFSDTRTPLISVIRGYQMTVAVYSISSLSEEFLSTQKFFSLFSFFLPKWLLMRLVFVQVWHPELSAPINTPASANFHAKFNRLNVVNIARRLLSDYYLPFYTSTTPPGEGFHYMAEPFTDPIFMHSKFAKNFEAPAGSFEILGGLSNPSKQFDSPTLSFIVDAFKKSRKEISDGL